MLYLVKYCMLNFFKEMWITFNEAQKEMRDMGIWNIPTYTGVWTYIDKPTYDLYIKKMAEDDQSSTK